MMAATTQFTINHLPTTDRGGNSSAHTPASSSGGDNAVARLALSWLYKMQSYNYCTGIARDGWGVL